MFSIASGRSANSSRIAAAGFIQASGEERSRSSRSIWLDWAMHSIASWARVELGVGISGRIGRDQRQVARIGQLDQRRFGRLLDRIAAAAELDIEPAREQRLEPVEIVVRGRRLALGEQPRQRALAAAGQRDQAVGAPFQRVEGDMRLAPRPAGRDGRDETSAQRLR